MKILMVCLGNICRSPLAEGIMKAAVAKAGLNWQVDSAGTAGYHVGEPPHRLSQKVAKLNGIDITAQQCRQFKQADIIAFDKIYVMDQDNYCEVKRICGKHWNAAKVDLLLNASFPGQNKEVPDPWYGGEDGYHHVFDLITAACDAIIAQHRNLL